MSRRSTMLCALIAAVGLAAEARAVPLWSWESGSQEGWGWTNEIDTGWGTPQPMWTDKVRSGFGATDGNLAYAYKTPATTGFGFDEATLLQASVITGIDPVIAARWDAFVANNLMFVDMTVQGQRLAPIDPNNANFVAYWPALNGPAQAGGFVGSYDNPIDLDTGATAQYQLVYSTEYYEGPRTRTFTWDYVKAGYDFTALMPTNDTQNYTFIVWSTNSNTTGLQAAMDNVRLYRARATDPTWGGAAAGTWSSAGSWANGSPDGVGSIAVLNYTAGTPAVAISLDASKTVGSLIINGAARNNLGTPIGNASGNPFPAPTVYTINSVGGATLTLDNGASEASIVATAAGNVINAPLAFNSNAVIDLTADVRTGNQDGVPGATGASLDLNGAVSIAAGKTLRTTSVGTLTLNANVTGAAGSAVSIGGGSTILSANGSRVLRAGSLAVATSAQLDLTNNAAVVDYSGGTSPLDAITAAVRNGYAGGAQNGKGIVTSSAASNQALGIVEASAILPAGATSGTVGGQTVDATAIVIRFTLKGDSNIDRAVNFTDLLALAQNYNTLTGNVWSDGDSDYDGDVDFGDLLAFAQNYNQSLSAAEVSLLNHSVATDFAYARSLVPEPTTLAALAGVATLAIRRRRRTSI